MKTKEQQTMLAVEPAAIQRKHKGINVCASMLSLLFILLTMVLPGVVLFSVIPPAFAESETSLFDSQGKPRAYIASDLTIYLWSGEPVAYLHDAGADVHVYGFNGKHLGWLINGGILFNHSGYAVCATKEFFSGATSYEPYKSYKQYQPYKSYKQYAPFRPVLYKTWSDLPCILFLKQGIR